MSETMCDGRCISRDKKTGGMIIQNCLWGNKEKNAPLLRQERPYHPERVDASPSASRVKGVVEDRSMASRCR